MNGDRDNHSQIKDRSGNRNRTDSSNSGGKAAAALAQIASSNANRRSNSKDAASSLSSSPSASISSLTGNSNSSNSNPASTSNLRPISTISTTTASLTPSATSSPSPRPRPASTANVALDLSNAITQDHPSSLSGNKRSNSNNVITTSPNLNSNSTDSDLNQETTGRNSKSKANPTSAHRAVAGVNMGSEVWRTSAAKRAEKAWALQTERTLHSDPKFKKYAASVERALATFDSVSEWADFIAFLGRLLKTFQAYPQYNVIPRKLIVAKRLSQCLNPALPSGVHSRSLEVYSHILQVIGPDGLRRDLSIWSPGLFSFFQFSSTSTKPFLLNLLDKHYLILNDDLRPVLKSLILALLPGLEEETGEFFDKTLRLLDLISESIDPQESGEEGGKKTFYENLWLAMITMPSIRSSALNYLSRRLPASISTMNEHQVGQILGNDLGLMVRGLISTLEDKESLVIRNSLEILTKHFRPDTLVFRKGFKENDKIKLIQAIISIVLRKDLSLNRRVYSWLLGEESSKKKEKEDVEGESKLISNEESKTDSQIQDSSTSYYRQFSLDLLRRSLVDEMEGVESRISEENHQYDLEKKTQAISNKGKSRELLLQATSTSSTSNLNSTITSQEILKPFRIFISLLDKFEIGQPLTSVFILDSLTILSRLLASLKVDGSSSDEHAAINSSRRKELATIGKMLFEAVDPYALYRQFFLMFKEDLSSSTSSKGRNQEDGLSLLKFILLEMEIHDDETRQVHLPNLLTSLLDLGDQRIRTFNHASQNQDSQMKELKLIERIIDVSDLLLEFIPSRVFFSIEETRSEEGDIKTKSHEASNPINSRFLTLCSEFYRSEEAVLDENALEKVGFQKSSDNLVKLLDLSSSLAFTFSKIRDSEVLSSSPEDSNSNETGTKTPTNQALQPLVDEKKDQVNSLISSSFRLLSHLFQLIDESQDFSLGKSDNIHSRMIDWNLNQWKLESVHHLELAETFHQVEFIIEALISGARCRGIKSNTQALTVSKRSKSLTSNVHLLDNRKDIEILLSKIFKYLNPRFSIYHLRSTQLFWEIVSIDRLRHVESVLSRSITEADGEERMDACDALGTLWRLSDDSSPASEVLDAPVLLILDMLRSSTWDERQLASTWLRCNLRSYTRLLDPLLRLLLNPDLIGSRKSSSIKCGDLKIEGWEYTKPFDVETINYSLSTILALARFGGVGMTKALSSTSIRRSNDPDLIKALEKDGVIPDGSYLDCLFDILIRFLRCEPSKEYRSSMAKANSSIQANLSELIQGLATKTQFEPQRFKQLETVLIERIIVSVHSGTTLRQNKMLHALHDVIYAQASSSSSQSDRDFSSYRRRSGSNHALGKERGSVSDQGESRGSLISNSSSFSVNSPHPLLLRMIRDGLSKPSNTPVLHHWTDFILMIIPYYRRSITSLLLPINECICGLLQGALQRISQSYLLDLASFNSNKSHHHHRNQVSKEIQIASTSGRDSICQTSDTDFTLLMNASERVLLLCLGESSNQDQSADEETAVLSPRLPAPVALAASSEKGDSTPTASSTSATASGGGLLNYVSNVFGQEAQASNNTNASLASHTMRSLHHTVRTLDSVWASTRAITSAEIGSVHSDALASLMAKVRSRCRKSLERLYRLHSGDVVEALIDCWEASADGQNPQDSSRAEATFDILAILAPSAQIVVTFLCDVLTTRANVVSSSGEKGKRAQAAPVVSDATLFSFLDSYLSRLDGATAVQVWPVVIILIKDLVANSSSRKSHIFPATRCFTTIGERICESASSLEDRRLKRDLQENFLKLVDLCTLISGRSFDQGNWIRRSGKDEHSSMIVTDSDANDEKMSSSVFELSGPSLIDSINDFLAFRALPALRKFGIDNDKIQSVCGNAVYYIIGPAMKTKSKALEIDLYALNLVAEMAKLPGTLKSWRTQVSDVFTDSRFFNTTIGASVQFRRIVFALMSSDRERFLELIGKITAAPSANIFTNRELEMLSRALNLRRLSFVIYSGEKDHFLPQLPAIQEKVVDILRTNVAELVHAEVYLCMRVLLCRFSGQHLASFWPVIITEMMRLFESVVDELPADGSDHLHLVLSACKFLDLLLTLQTEDFQIHQWMFVTDTIDVVYPPDDWQSESIVDRLAVAIEERRPIPQSATQSSKTTDPFSQEGESRFASLSRRKGAAAAVAQAQNPSNALSPTAIARTFGSTDTSRLDLDSLSSRAKLRRPLLSAREVSSIDALAPFFANVGIANYEAVYRSSGEDVDWEKVEEGLIRDMFEV